MTLVDLSRDITHKMPRILTHPPIIITPFGTHEEIREADGYKFSSATLSLAMGDHAGTHVDAPVHFDARPGAKGIDEMPLENFFTEAVCLDLVAQAAQVRHLDRGPAEGGSRPPASPSSRRTPCCCTWTSIGAATARTPTSRTFPGLTKELATWLGKKGIMMFGVEAVSPGRVGRNNFEVHHVCRDLGFTHMEGLVNLDKLVGKGRFRFIGFPLQASRAAPAARSAPWPGSTIDRCRATGPSRRRGRGIDRAQRASRQPH